MDFLDELSAGLSVVSAPGFQSTFALRYSAAALVLFVIPQVVGLVLEPPIYLLADRRPKRRFVIGGLLALGMCDLLAGVSWSLAPLAIALAFTGAASGVGVNLAQATLMDEHPEDRDRVMTLWALAGMGGDLAAPALVWAISVFALGWRAGFLACSVLLFGYAFALGRRTFPPGRAAAREATPPLRDAIRAALGNRRLLGWLFGVWLCGLLDEILVAFGSMHLKHELGLDVGERSLVLMAFVAGSVGGLGLTEKLLRLGVDPVAILRASGLACAVCFGAWIVAPDGVSSAALLGGVGLLAAPMYPIAQAQAYRALPGQSGMVNAVAVVFRPLDIALPLLIGVVADRLGLSVALALLMAQPLGLFAIALLNRTDASLASRAAG